MRRFSAAFPADFSRLRIHFRRGRSRALPRDWPYNDNVRTFLKAVGALALFTGLFGVWILLFVLWPIYGITRCFESGSPIWLVWAALVPGVAALAWHWLERRFAKDQNSSYTSAPLI